MDDFSSVNTNEEVDQLVNKVKEAGGTVVQEPTVSQGFYGAMFKDLDGHHFNFWSAKMKFSKE